MYKKLFTKLERKKERKKNRRSFPRVPYERPLAFTICLPDKREALYDGMMVNISQGGMLFASAHTPPLSSIIVFETDVAMLSQCIEIENVLFSIQDYLFGKVVRVFRHDERDDVMVGLSFIKEAEHKREDVREAIQSISIT